MFTYYVVKGLEGEADIAPHDGTVTADELAELRTHAGPREDQRRAESYVRPQQLRQGDVALLHPRQCQSGDRAGAAVRLDGDHGQHG
ncbi:MAG: hypothetical protein WDO73_29975 [Ignavibacteriota bacterium]